MTRRPLRSITATLLVVLLGLLNTGMPSHSHETGRVEATRGGALISADLHSHGVLLLESLERVPATTAQSPAPAVRTGVTPGNAPDRRLRTFDAAPLRPTERGPPSAAPRAPPQQI